MKIGFVGLGVMGFPMAGHLSKSGHQVFVYNRTLTKAQEWAEIYTGEVLTELSELAAQCDIVCTCVGNDDDVRAVVLAEQGLLKAMKHGSLLIDHTTASASLAKELGQMCQAQGVGFVDAPVSGGQAGAEAGQLTIMAGGNEEHFNQAQEAFGAYAKASKLIGPVGHGQLAKMMNQICIAGVVQGLAEALHFGQSAGVDCHSVIEAISQGAAQSWQMDNRAKTMLKGEYEFGFAVDWMRKDLAIALDEAKVNGSSLALTAMVDQFYAQVQKLGGQRWDTSSLLTRL